MQNFCKAFGVDDKQLQQKERPETWGDLLNIKDCPTPVWVSKIVC